MVVVESWWKSRLDWLLRSSTVYIRSGIQVISFGDAQSNHVDALDFVLVLVRACTSFVISRTIATKRDGPSEYIRALPPANYFSSSLGSANHNLESQGAPGRGRA